MILPSPPRNQTGKNEVFSWEKQARPVPQTGHSGRPLGIHLGLHRLRRGHGQRLGLSLPGRQIRRREFLVAYFTIALFLGLIGVSGEIAFGRWGRTGPLGTFRKALTRHNLPLKSIGIIPVAGSWPLASDMP
jgi:hypothetical protein